MNEEPLRGGFMSTVVRVGDTVRRTAGAWTPTVQRLLAHARGRGVVWIPEPLGYDQAGREVLSFIAGDVPHAMPAWVWSEHVLTGVARALREWHDASADFDVTGALWQLDAHEPREVICHNDFAPYNCVFKNGRFAGAIDFDVCSPGPRIWDIAYTAYRFVPIMPPADAHVPDGARERSPFDVEKLRARLALFLHAYAGGSTPLDYPLAHVLATVSERLAGIADWTTRRVAMTGDPALAQHAVMYRAHARWVTRPW